MNVGSIPVILSDKYVLPFNDIIDWNKCSIRIKENEINNLLEIIENNLHKEDELRKNVIEIYNKYFCSTSKIIDTSVKLESNKKLNKL